MANGAIIITWGAPVRGREAKGLEIFGKALSYYDELAKEGRIHGHKEFFGLTGNFTERTGTMIVEGDLDKLVKLQLEPDNQRLLAEAGQITDNFCVQLCEANSEESIGRYMETLQGLGLT